MADLVIGGRYRTRDDVPDCDGCDGKGVVEFSWFPPMPCPDCGGTGKQLDALREFRRGVPRDG